MLPMTATYSTESGHHWQHSRNLSTVLTLSLQPTLAISMNNGYDTEPMHLQVKPIGK